MKIPAIQRKILTKPTFLNRVKNLLGSVRYTLKLLKEDVFEYVSPRPYILVDGKKVYKTKHVMIDGKKVPKSQLRFVNWDEADVVGVRGGYLKFYPEDLKKMEKMTTEEQIAYKQKLMDEKRYISNFEKR